MRIAVYAAGRGRTRKRPRLSRTDGVGVGHADEVLTPEMCSRGMSGML